MPLRNIGTSLKTDKKTQKAVDESTAFCKFYEV